MIVKHTKKLIGQFLFLLSKSVNMIASRPMICDLKALLMWWMSQSKLYKTLAGFQILDPKRQKNALFSPEGPQFLKFVK